MAKKDKIEIPEDLNQEAQLAQNEVEENEVAQDSQQIKEGVERCEQIVIEEIVPNVENKTEFTKEQQDEESFKEFKRTHPDESKPPLQFLTKTEGFLMFVILLLTTFLCSVLLQGSLTGHDSELNQQIKVLNTQIGALETQITTLETKLDVYQQAVADRPINITVDMDGENKDYVYDPNTGDLVDPNSGHIFPAGFDTRPFLGVSFYNIDEVEPNPIGLKIDCIFEHSPAEFAGIKAGDIIMAVNGNPIKTFDDLDAVISQCAAKDKINIQLATISEVGIECVDVEATLTYRGNFNLEN